MNGIGPAIRLGLWPHVAPENWQRDAWEEGRVTWRHEPSAMVFQVYSEGLSSYDAARLIHVCDGATLPNQEVREWYGRAAILLEGRFLGQVSDLLLQVVAADDDGPPPRLTAEEEAFYAEIEEELRELRKPRGDRRPLPSLLSFPLPPH